MNELFDKKIVLLATGGTIAGLARDARDNVAYTAAQVGVDQLLLALPHDRLPQLQLVGEQVAQLDSKDMSTAVWSTLALRCRFWLGDPQVRGIVVTHGTDTMEETAYFLHRMMEMTGGCTKPLVMTGAMRPASALVPDGPQNMLDALAVATDGRACGVSVVFAGQVHGAIDVHKLHPYRLDAFSSGEAGPIAMVEEGRLRLLHGTVADSDPARPDAAASGTHVDRWSDLLRAQRSWPRVEIVSSHAAADGWLVEAMLAGAAALGDPVRGIVVAGTGNGSVHQVLEAALVRARGAGVEVRRASRCSGSRTVTNPAAKLPDSDGLSPVKARIALMLELLARDEAAPAAATDRLRSMP